MPHLYWTPPPLALPPRAETLHWMACNVDRGAAWFWAKTLYLQAILDPEGDPYTLSGQTWDMLRAIHVDRHRHGPSEHEGRWISSYVMPKHRRARGQLWDLYGERQKRVTAFLHAHLGHAALPTQIHGDRFAVVHLAFLERSGWASGHDSQHHAFLVARREGDRWRVYPRSLICTRWDVTVAKVLTGRQVASLAKRWDKAFDALPRWAKTHEEAAQGAPLIGASLPTPGIDHHKLSQGTEDPYWQHAAAAVSAALCLAGVAFPPPPDRFYNSYHCTIRSAYVSPRDSNTLVDPRRLQCPSHVSALELPYGWHVYRDEDAPQPSPEQAIRLRVAHQALLEVLQRFAPDTPFFFDTLEVRGASSTRFCDDAYAKYDNLYGTGQHFLWVKEQDMRMGSAHAALDAMARLPSDWAAALRDAVQTRLAAALAG